MRTRFIGTAIAAALAFFFCLAAEPAAADAPETQAADEATTVTKFNFPKAGDTRVVGQEEIAEMLRDHGSDLLVVNFWATWCSPCVAEIPYFVRLSKDYPESRVRVVGLSADLKRDVDRLVIPFLREREIPYSNLVVFADTDPLIRMFSGDWGGDIPVTFFYNKEGKKVGEILSELKYEELKEATEKILDTL